MATDPISRRTKKGQAALNRYSGDPEKYPDASSINMITEDAHIAGIFEGDGSIGILFKKGDGSKSLANTYSPRIRAVITQREPTGILVKVRNYLKEKHGITSTIQLGKGVRGDNLYIEGWANIKAFIRMLDNVNIISSSQDAIGPKAFTLAMIKHLIQNVNHRTKEGMEIYLDARNFLPKVQSRKEPNSYYEEKFGFPIGSTNGKAKPIVLKIQKDVAALRQKLRAQLKAENLNIDAAYISGLVCAEGTFFTGIYPRKNAKKATPAAPLIVQRLSVKMHASERNTLLVIAKAIGDTSPRIKKCKGVKAYVYFLENKNTIVDKATIFFAKAGFDFHLIKHSQFETFINVRKALMNGKHLTREGTIELINLIYDTPRATTVIKRRLTREELLNWANSNWKTTSNKKADEANSILDQEIEKSIEAERTQDEKLLLESSSLFAD